MTADAFQLVGIGLLVTAASLMFGVVGGLIVAGVAMIVVGVAIERGN